MASGKPDLPEARRALSTVLALALPAWLVQMAIAYFHPLPSSFAKYGLAARQWLAGELPGERLADFSPLYLELHVALLRLGLDPARLLPWVQQAALAIAIGVVGWRLRRRGAAWALALGAALVMALDHPLLIYARILEPEALLVLSVCLWLAALDSEAPVPGRLLAAGVFAAAGVLLRPTLVPVHWLLVPLFLWLRRPPGSGGKRWLRDVACFLAPLLLAAFWSSARLERATGREGSPGMSPGTVFYEGNHPLSNGTSAVYPPLVRLVQAHQDTAGAGSLVSDPGHVLYRTIARQELADPELPIAAVNRFWAGRALAYLGDHPGRAWRLATTKLRNALARQTWHDVPTAAELELRLPTPAVPFSVLAALGLLGMLACVRRWREHLLDYGLFGAQLAVMLAFYVSARQRLILLPVLVFFGALAIKAWRDSPREGRWRGPALAALLALALSLPDPAHQDATYRERLGARAAAARGALMAGLGDRFFVEAAHQVAEIVALSAADFEELRPAEIAQGPLLRDAAAQLELLLPTFPPAERPSAEFDLATLELRAGSEGAADARLRLLADEGRIFFRGCAAPSDPRFWLARLAASKGDAAGARRWLDEALAATPGDPFVLAELFVLAGEARYRDLLGRYYSATDGEWLVGRAALAHGRPALAIAALSTVVERLPFLRRARLELAAAHAGLGDPRHDDLGIEQLIVALRQSPVPTADAALVTPMIVRWAARHPEPEAQLQGLSLLVQHGAFPEAGAVLERLPESMRSHPYAKRASAVIATAKALSF
jgi:hypothetical protein